MFYPTTFSVWFKLPKFSKKKKYNFSKAITRRTVYLSFISLCILASTLLYNFPTDVCSFCYETCIFTTTSLQLRLETKPVLILRVCYGNILGETKSTHKFSLILCTNLLSNAWVRSHQGKNRVTWTWMLMDPPPVILKHFFGYWRCIQCLGSQWCPLLQWLSNYYTDLLVVKFFSIWHTFRPRI